MAPNDYGPRQCRGAVGEGRPKGRVFCDVLAVPDRKEQYDHAKSRGFSDLPGPDAAHIHAHDHRGGNGDRDRESAPRTFAERLHHDQSERRKDDDHDSQRADEGNRAGNRAHFHFHHLAERPAVTPNGTEQNNEVLHCARKHHADENP
jgi:hypothetical protein